MRVSAVFCPKPAFLAKFSGVPEGTHAARWLMHLLTCHLITYYLLADPPQLGHFAISLKFC